MVDVGEEEIEYGVYERVTGGTELLLHLASVEPAHVVEPVCHVRGRRS